MDEFNELYRSRPMSVRANLTWLSVLFVVALSVSAYAEISSGADWRNLIGRPVVLAGLFGSTVGLLGISLVFPAIIFGIKRAFGRKEAFPFVWWSILLAVVSCLEIYGAANHVAGR